MSAKALVDEQIKSLGNICELESDVIQAFHGALIAVAERHLANLSATVSPVVTEKIKIGQKTTTKRASKPKEDKLSSKNAYHFFVAAKMGEVKAAGVEAKGRMKRIGEMWKELTDEDRSPYKAMATRYNDHVQNEMKSADWKVRREAIMAAANLSATQGAAIELDDDVDDDVDETSTVVSCATVIATPTPAPVVVATPAPVVNRKPRTKK